MRVEYRIDSSDRIIEVSANWHPFALENGAPGLTAAAVIGCLLWDFVLGDEVRQVYEMLFQAVRRRQKPATVPFRCDSPTVRRYMELRCVPLAQENIRIEGRLLGPQPKASESLPPEEETRVSTLIRVCSWRLRINPDGAGRVEIDEAVQHGRLLEAPSPTPITHGICPDCYQRVAAEIQMMDSV